MNEEIKLKLLRVRHISNIQALRALVTQEKANVLFLVETKNQEHVQCIKRHLHLQNHSNANPVGIVGGLAVLWTNLVSSNVVESAF